VGCSHADTAFLKEGVKSMVVSRVTKVSNPRKRKRLNPRKMSLKQKLAFGTKRQRAAAKASLSRKRSNPKRHSTARTKKRRVVRNARHTVRRAVKRVVKRRRANPAHILSLGLINPRPSTGRKTKRRKKNTMAKTRTRRRRTAKANPRRRRRNSVRVIVRRKNRRRVSASNPRRTRRHVRHHRRAGARRNPQLFGRQASMFEVTKALAGGLAGVAITKAVPNMLPASISASSPFMSVLVSAGVAVGAGMLVKSLVKSDPMLGDAVMFGGLMQAFSVGINAFLPSVGTVIGLQGLGNGMGDIVPGRFPVPQNPIMAGQQMALPAPAVSPAAAHAASGVGAIFNPFGRAM